MDRQDLTWAQVALEARIRRLAPALDALAVDHGGRLRQVATAFRRMANGYSPINYAADELDAIADWGAGILVRPAPVQLGLAVETIAKLAREAPSNRFSRRADEARQERQRKRQARSERLRDMAQAAEGSTQH